MSYAELVRIANNDALAEGMSEEEYESLSITLWRKFGEQHRIGVSLHPSEVSPSEPSAVSKEHNLIASIRSVLGMRSAERTLATKP